MGAFWPDIQPVRCSGARVRGDDSADGGDAVAGAIGNQESATARLACVTDKFERAGNLKKVLPKYSLGCLINCPNYRDGELLSRSVWGHE